MESKDRKDRNKEKLANKKRESVRLKRYKHYEVTPVTELISEVFYAMRHYS